MGEIACVGNGSLYCVRPTDGYYATTAPYHDDDEDDDGDDDEGYCDDDDVDNYGYDDETFYRNEKHVHYDGYDKRVNSDDGKIMCSA